MASQYGSSSMKSKLPMNVKKKKKNETTAKKKMVRSEAKEKKEKVGAKTGRGSKKFPDMNKDGKITKADILMGRGVIKGKKKKKKKDTKK
jgi:hypothetical protein